MNRRDTLKLALGTPLILAAERMLGGTARALNRDARASTRTPSRHWRR
ncbi:hypothetical protein [Streptomyces griseoruber]|nr:hypothetical protein [Streptomyces griseoruber]